MVTMVGLQTDFTDVLNNLIELDYDAIEAYDEAIKRLENEEFKEQFRLFRADHFRHTTELRQLLLELGTEDIASGPSMKEYLTKGKVVLADIIGDVAILMAMRSNEVDTNTAYERALGHDEKLLSAEPILQRGLADERRHKAWIEEAIDRINNG